MSTVRRRVGATATAVALVPVFAGVAEAAAPVETASVVADWNAVAVSTLTGDTAKVVPENVMYLGFVHAAIYDAVVGLRPRYEPYRRHGHAPRGASATAAAAAAGHKILETYSPYAQGALDQALAASLAKVPDGAAKRAGIAYGERVARDLIAERAHDGRNAPVQFTRAQAPGVWRPTPPANLPMAVPWLGRVKPLLARSAAQFEPPAPPALTSRRYTRDFAEVKAMGSATSTARTAVQTATARFFSGNVFVQVNAALRDQAAKRGLGIADSARMFAATAMTTADVAILTWRSKLVRAYWRPITAIQLAGTDGNPATTADPAWTPLIVTPNYPDYVSGYNTVIAASTRALEHVVGPRLDLTLTSTAVPGEVRHYRGGASLRADVVDARIWLGIHFRTADTAARTLGIDLADWVARHYFQPRR
ncbi:vanadium-dependent haloperoxidase [Actinoplanes sp. Pm04-4]|uniref:Vanadium-dependent haloperoxidase n=1 Tax=Paractinoplanes pyxinae TaxID=2997416 RepID=A0ABT4BGD7_9ACTN|nr:vanadium-dependent haloperoxidase [Actinoplanes pyxinae]MCY1145516.1 vanadium-dependent haloperoxidase [Actinoplanes pyxinae]